MEARVLATAGKAEKLSLCRELGASQVFDYVAPDLVGQVKKLTRGEGVDVVFDSVGGDLFDVARRMVRFEGRFLVIGFASGRIASAPTNHMLVKNYSVVGVHWGLFRDREPEEGAHELSTTSRHVRSGHG